MKKNLPCWNSAGQLFTAVEEDPEIAPGFPLRVINLTTGECSPPCYPTWEELVEGEGLDEDLIGVLGKSMTGERFKKPEDWN